MKNIILTSILLAVSHGFARTPSPGPAPEPSILGDWELTSRACTSNAPINDGVRIGQDTISISNQPDKTFQYKMKVSGCETMVTGTYMIDGKKLTYNSTSSQSCKDANPVPMVDTQTLYIAYISDKEAVLVSSGAKAAMSCPAGDALVMHFSKEEKESPDPSPSPSPTPEPYPSPTPEP